MRYCLNKKNREKSFEGYALLFVIILISVMSLIVLSMSLTLTEQIRSNRETVLSTQAFYAAESGMERALYALYQEGLDIPLTESMSFSGSLLLGQEDESSFEVIAQKFDDRITIESKGIYHRVVRDLEANISFTPQ